MTVAVAGTILLSCGGNGSNQTGTNGPTGSYVARVADTDAFIGIVVGKLNVVAFVSDGAHKVGIRLTGPRLGSGFDMTLPIGVRLAGVIDSKQIVGALTTGQDPPHTFTAKLATGSGGLYAGIATVDAKQVGLAWVVFDTGEQRGSRISDGAVAEAPKLDPTKSTIDLNGTKVDIAKTTPGNAVGVGFGGGFGGGGGQIGFGGGGFGTFGQFGGQIGTGGAVGGIGGGGGKFGFGG